MRHLFRRVAEFIRPPVLTAHVCHLRRCRPTATTRRINHPSGAIRWETHIKETCPLGGLHSQSYILSRVRITRTDVVWIPARANPRARVDMIPVGLITERGAS